jgi:hypothetical protein
MPHIVTNIAWPVKYRSIAWQHDDKVHHFNGAELFAAEAEPFGNLGNSTTDQVFILVCAADTLCWLLASSTWNMSSSAGSTLFIFEPDDERSQHT